MIVAPTGEDGSCATSPSSAWPGHLEYFMDFNLFSLLEVLNSFSLILMPVSSLFSPPSGKITLLSTGLSPPL